MIQKLGEVFFFSSRRRHTRCLSDWSSDVCSSDLLYIDGKPLTESLVLHPGMIVSTVPKTTSERPGDDWRGSVGFFRNDPAFNEMLQVMNTEREAEKEDRKSVV